MKPKYFIILVFINKGIQMTSYENMKFFGLCAGVYSFGIFMGYLSIAF